MTTVFRVLGVSGESFYPPCEEESKIWNFSSQNIPTNSLEKIDRLRPLIYKHISLYIEYNLHCNQLVQDLLDKTKARNIQRIIDQIKTALMMAELLEQIYHVDYLHVPEKIHRLRLEKKMYRSWLSQQGYQFNENPPDVETESVHVGVTISYLTSQLSWLRLSTLRLHHLLITIAKTFKGIEVYSRGIFFMEKFSRPILYWIIWPFYIPRIFTEVFFTLKHTIPHPWMEEQERALGWVYRLKTQWEERWFVILHDTAWLICGIVTCFFLTGGMSSLIAYVLLTTQLFNLVLAEIEGYIEINRIQKIKNAYIEELQNEPPVEQQEQISGYITCLENKMNYEQQHGNLRTTNNSILVLAVTLDLPVLMFDPVIPFIGALLAVLMTIVCYIVLQSLERKKPDKIYSIASISLFKPTSKLENHIVTIEDNEPSFVNLT